MDDNTHILSPSGETEIGKSSSTFANVFAQGVARQGEGNKANKKRDARGGKTSEGSVCTKVVSSDTKPPLSSCHVL